MNRRSATSRLGLVSRTRIIVRGVSLVRVLVRSASAWIRCSLALGSSRRFWFSRRRRCHLVTRTSPCGGSERGGRLAVALGRGPSWWRRSRARPRPPPGWAPTCTSCAPWADIQAVQQSSSLSDSTSSLASSSPSSPSPARGLSPDRARGLREGHEGITFRPDGGFHLPGEAAKGGRAPRLTPRLVGKRP